MERLEHRDLLAAATIHWDDARQSIDGFGGSSAWSWQAFSQAKLDLLFSTTAGAGLSLLRSRIAPGGLTSENGIMQQVAPYGVTSWSTPWTPPREWKTNHDNNNGGSLDPARYQDYADLLANYCLEMKVQGIPLYAMSLQNEPDANVPYESCVWSEQQFADFLPYVGEAFAARGLDTKIMLSERSGWSFDTVNTIMANPALSKYVGILAAHNYNQTFAPYRPVAGTAGLPVWQTEVYLRARDAADPNPDLSSALNLADDIREAISVGASAYHYWWLDVDAGVGALLNAGAATKRLWSMGQYSRFVRPGWVTIGTTEDTPSGLGITAFKDPASSAFAIVVVNEAAADVSESFTLNGVAAGSVTPFVTSATDSLAAKPAISLSGGTTFSATIGGRSIVTYYGRSSSAPVVQAPGNFAALPPYGNTHSRVALSWTDNATAETGYTVERSTDGTSWSVVGSTLAPNTTAFVDMGLSENTRYFYRVSAVGAAGAVARSAVVSTSTTLLAPSAVRATSNGSGYNLTWTNTSAVATGVVVERSFDGLTFSRIATLSGRATSYNDTSLTTGFNPAKSFYQYRARNIRGEGMSTYGSWSSGCNPPTNFAAATVGPTSIGFTWTSNSIAGSGAAIEQYNSATGSWKVVSPSSLEAADGGWTLTGLAENTSRTFRMRALLVADSLGSSYTSSLVVTTPFAVPDDLLAIATSATSTNLSWSDNSGIESNYSVDRSSDGVAWTTLTSTLPANSTTYTDAATPSGSVLYRVRATTTGAASASGATRRLAGPLTLGRSAEPVTGTTVVLSVTPPAFGSGPLAYAWSLDGTPPAPVGFSVNGTSAATTTTATFAKAGSYTFRVTVTDAAGFTTSGTIAVTVNATLTSIAITANGSEIVKSTWQQCAAVASDQFGNPLATQPVFTWSVVSGGGSIASTGLYTAPAAAASPVVQATAGGVSGRRTLSVLDTARLIASYSFNEGSGDVARNGLGTGNHAPITGNYSFVTGRMGSAVQMDGPGSVWVGRSAPLDIVGQITLSAWIKPASLNGTQMIVGQAYGLWPNQIGNYMRISGGKYEVGYYNGGYYAARAAIPAGDLNTWVHLVGTYDGKTWRLYRNGTSIASMDSGIGAKVAPNAWRIGSSDEPGEYFSGAIDSVRLYGQALSAAEVLALSSPAILVTKAAAAAASPVTGSSTALSVAAVDPDSNSDALLTYTWATTGTTPAAVTFSANGSSAAKDTTARFSKPGSYSFQVTIRDAAGLTTTRSTSVSVSQTLTSVVVTPATVSLSLSGTQQFAAAALDQFGVAMPTQPAFTWSLSAGAGSLTAAGLYGGPGVAGSATVRATGGGISGTASVSTALVPSMTPLKPTLLAVSDSGVSASDGITRQTSSLQFTVAGTTSGATVRLYAGSTLLASATATGATTTLTTSTALGDGVYSITAVQVENGKDPSAASPAAALTIDTAAPRVSGVTVAGSGWSPAFLGFLSGQGLGAGGYVIPTGGRQLDPLPWGNLNRVRMKFTENVSLSVGQLAIRGVNVASYATSGLNYDSSSQVAEWSLVSAPGADKLLLHLSATATDLAGNPLDGEWTDGQTAAVSGNGVAGGDLFFRLNVLPGDVTRDGVVDAADLNAIRRRQLLAVGVVGFSIFYDTDGSAVIDATDLNAVRRRQLLRLPVRNPT
jgi:O-glycosyl hydrolase